MVSSCMCVSRWTGDSGHAWGGGGDQGWGDSDKGWGGSDQGWGGGPSGDKHGSAPSSPIFVGPALHTAALQGSVGMRAVGC